MRSGGRFRFYAALVFTLPVVLVKAAGWYLGFAEPSSASAQHAVHTPDLQLPDFSDEQSHHAEVDQSVVRHVAALRDMRIIRSPLYYEPEPEAEAVGPGQTSNQKPVEAADSRETFKLGGVMVGGAGGRAIIDGKAYSTGDIIAGTQWKVQSVDIGSGSATISHEITEESTILTITK